VFAVQYHNLLITTKGKGKKNDADFRSKGQGKKMWMQFLAQACQWI
jgi:hypothetical protein